MGRPNMFDDLAADLDAVPAAAVDAVVDRFHLVAREIATGAGMGWIGAALHSTPVDLMVADGVATVTVVGAPVGLWVWAETGTRPHVIAPNPRRNRRRTKSGKYRPLAMTIPGGDPVGVPVHHPGTRGRALWTWTVDRVDGELTDLVLSAIDISVGT